ncbi:hypothetical protein E4P29_25360 [Rhodococcus sp. 1R11]|uniref:hypothetical protein n=1 Tax=Rhodococcus sp. 1R11 TaxID=2559614 RepID=UPI001071AA44|nr:hypothetical protein [Rhodococcus sp. 1R11]TFI40244.1 hypothetical protein E4P29_25360 [Rhodococcus sp. 1R11]
MCRTYVWADQHPYVSGFYTLVPHLIDTDRDTVQLSGHAGGAISGFLIAKIGIHRESALKKSRIEAPSGSGKFLSVQNISILLVEAMVRAAAASRIGGGRFLFIDTTMEPDFLVKALKSLNFLPINGQGSPMWCLKLDR